APSAQVASVPASPAAFELDPPAPNPAAHSTQLRYTLGREAFVGLEVFDALGRRVRTLASDAAAAPGPHELSWNLRDDGGRRLGAGVYYVRARLGTEIRTTRVVVTR